MIRILPTPQTITDQQHRRRVMGQLNRIANFQETRTAPHCSLCCPHHAAVVGPPLPSVGPVCLPVELGRPTIGLGRVGWTSSVRAGWTGSDSCPTGWIGQAYLLYLSVGRPTRISAHTKISGWATNPRVGRPILSDGLGWTSNPVRRVGLGGQLLSEPWASSGALALGLGFWVLSVGSGRVEKKGSEPNPTATLNPPNRLRCNPVTYKPTFPRMQQRHKLLYFRLSRPQEAAARRRRWGGVGGFGSGGGRRRRGGG
jgi:hypothetical protein